MHVVHGWQKRTLPLQGTRYYYPEEVLAMFRRVSKPLWLVVGDTHIPIHERNQSFAAEAVAAYHNDLCQVPEPDTAWAQDTQRAEAEAQAHMEAESSDDEDYVTSEEDIDYSAYNGIQFFYV